MENDLISRSALLTEVEGAFNRHYEQSSYQFIHDFFRCAVKRIKNAPAVDAVEVVRCKDCEYSFRNRGHKKDACPIRDANIWLGGDGFCSLGVRRGEDGE